MVNFPVQFAEQSGIGAFNINLKSFIFQLITFLIVLLIFKRWILPPLLRTLEARRKSVEQDLEHAKQTEEKLAQAEQKSAEIIQLARTQADKALAEANTQARDILAQAEQAAGVQAKRIVDEAAERLGQERQKLHDQLKGELADLVVLTTEKVLDHKLNEREDRHLVENALKGLVND